jgi:3-phosphoshikimate 1-carboxyvinyltransferase
LQVIFKLKGIKNHSIKKSLFLTSIFNFSMAFFSILDIYDLDILSKFGALTDAKDGEITVSHNKLCGCTIDLTDIPDLLPILAVVASFAEKKTNFVGGERLRLKESDRLETVATMLKSLGGKADVREDGITVYPSRLCGGVVDGAGDHRIVMAACIAAAYCDGNVTICGAEAVDKSYPRFFEDYIKVGGKADGIHLW